VEERVKAGYFMINVSILTITSITFLFVCLITATSYKFESGMLWPEAKQDQSTSGLKKTKRQWVEANQSNFRIYPTDMYFLPHGTMLKALIQMLNTDVRGC
jgi:hypothetical protein